VFNLSGQGWNEPTEEFVNEVIDVIYEPAYLHMPSRLVILRKLGKLLESQNQYTAAIRLRTARHQELADSLAINTELDPFLVSTLKNHNAARALDDAKLHLKLGDPESALAVLSSIVADSDNLESYIVDEANSLQSQAQAFMQEL